MHFFTTRVNLENVKKKIKQVQLPVALFCVRAMAAGVVLSLPFATEARFAAEFTEALLNIQAFLLLFAGVARLGVHQAVVVAGRGEHASLALNAVFQLALVLAAIAFAISFSWSDEISIVFFHAVEMKPLLLSASVSAFIALALGSGLLRRLDHLLYAEIFEFLVPPLIFLIVIMCVADADSVANIAGVLWIVANSLTFAAATWIAVRRSALVARDVVLKPSNLLSAIPISAQLFSPSLLAAQLLWGPQLLLTSVGVDSQIVIGFVKAQRISQVVSFVGPALQNFYLHKFSLDANYQAARASSWVNLWFSAAAGIAMMSLWIAAGFLETEMSGTVAKPVLLGLAVGAVFTAASGPLQAFLIGSGGQKRLFFVCAMLLSLFWLISAGSKFVACAAEWMAFTIFCVSILRWWIFFNIAASLEK